MDRTYNKTWLVLRETKQVKLQLLDPLAKTRIVRGISKEKNSDPAKPLTEKIFVSEEKTKEGHFLVLTLARVIKTRNTVPL